MIPLLVAALITSGVIIAGQQLGIDRRGKDRLGQTPAHTCASGADVGERLIRARVAVKREARRHEWCEGRRPQKRTPRD